VSTPPSARPIRVLLLCEGLRLAGGVERFVCQLADRLAGEGMQVAIGSVDTPADALRYPVAPAVRVVAGSTPRDGSAGTRLPRALSLLAAQWRVGRSLARLMRREAPDVIVLNGLTTACSALLFAPGCAPRTICCDHNHHDARSRPWRWLRRRLYPRVAALVSLTEADAPRFRALNPRTHVIHNASTLHADTPALPAEPRVVAVGRFVAQKGFDLLLQAWRDVQRARPDARLRIVGDGPLRDAARADARVHGLDASVAFVDPTPAIERELRDAALFVLPSRYEGMPLVLLEAQALGVPAVAFDCPTGPAEILGDGEGGLLVPPGDVPALAAALLRLLGDAALRERMAGAAIRRSRQQFSPAEHFRRWSELVREVAAGARRDGAAA